MHATGDCVAVRTRFPVAGVVADSPASNGWKPGFMTDLMAKDLDLALAYGAQAGVPMAVTATARQALTAASTAGYGREDFSAVAKVVAGLAGLRLTRRLTPDRGRTEGCAGPALILAADHRARGVVTIERYADYVGALARRPAPLRRHPGHRPAAAPTSSRRGAIDDRRTAPTCRSTAPGWPARVFELDDRLVASVERAAPTAAPASRS